MAYNPYTDEEDTSNNMFGVMNTNAANNLNNQFAFRPNSLLDNRIKTMQGMEDQGYTQPNLPALKQRDWDQFQKKGIPLSLPRNQYKGVEGWTADAGNVMNDASNFGLFSHANAAESDGQYLMDKENFDYNALYGDNYSDLKIPGINEPRIPYLVGRPDSGQRYRDYNQKRNMGSVLQSGIGKDPYNYNHPRFAWATYPDFEDLSPQELGQELDRLEAIEEKERDQWSYRPWPENALPEGHTMQKKPVQEKFVIKQRKPVQELGTEHSDIAADKIRSLPTFGLSGILKGLKNQFKINPEKQKEFDSWEENKNQKGWGYIGDTGLRGNIYEGSGGKKFSLVDPTTGFNVLQNKNWQGGTGKSLQEQINEKNAWIADRLFKGKGLSGKARAYAKLNKLGTYADKETFTPPPGGGPLNEPGGEWVGGAPAYTHQGIGGGEYTNEIGNVEYQDPYDPGGGEAAGGLMRIHSRGRYSKGGRVGILSVF